MERGPNVSVIIPFYSVEKYIEKCARSLFEQTLREIEYIFIDDCSPDKSIEILIQTLEKYPHRKSQVKIFRNKTNKGISKTRNIGLDAATGEYVIYCDGDDWVDPKLYEDLYKAAKEENSDIIWCDYIIENRNYSVRRTQNCIPKKEDCIKALLSNNAVLSMYLWHKLVKRNLYTDNNIAFQENINIREDFLILIQLFYYSNKVSRISGGFYHYRIRDDSISKIAPKSNEDSFFQHRLKANYLVYKFLEKNNAVLKYEKEIMCSKLNLKNLFLCSSKNINYWIQLFPEANAYIFQSHLSSTKKIALWASINFNPTIFPVYLFLARYIKRLFEKMGWV